MSSPRPRLPACILPFLPSFALLHRSPELLITSHPVPTPPEAPQHEGPPIRPRCVLPVRSVLPAAGRPGFHPGRNGEEAFHGRTAPGDFPGAAPRLVRGCGRRRHPSPSPGLSGGGGALLLLAGRCSHLPAGSGLRPVGMHHVGGVGGGADGHPDHVRGGPGGGHRAGAGPFGRGRSVGPGGGDCRASGAP